MIKFINKYFMVYSVEGFFQVKDDSTCEEALVHISLDGFNSINE